jgi:hypothetical protein
MDERLIQALQKLGRATWISSVLFLVVTVALGVSSWFTYRLQAETVALRAETRAMREEMARMMQQSEQLQAQGLVQSARVGEQLKRLDEKLSAAQKDKK